MEDRKNGMGPKGRGGKGQRGGNSGKDMTTMLSLQDQCTYNFQCESDCCMEPRKKKGGKGKRGRGGRGDRDDDDDDDRRLLQRGGKGGRGQSQKGGMTICMKESHCDMDKDEVVGMKIWNFFSGLIIGVLMIIAAFQCWYYKRQLKQVGQ